MEFPFSLTEAWLYTMDRVAVALLIGCGVAASSLILDSNQRQITARPLRQLIDTALPLLAITTIAVLLLRTAALADVAISETAPYLIKVITGDTFGTLWIGRVAILLLLTVMWLVSRRQITEKNGPPLIVGGAITAFLISAGSHAGDEGALSFDNFNNTAHIVAGCLWGGAIIAYLAMLKEMRQQNSPAITQSAARLSIVATLAVAIIAVTALINGWQRLDSITQLWSSGYGITLLIKVTFVTAMLAIGSLNRFRIIPAIARAEEGATLRLQRALQVDTVLFLLVIACAAALGMQSPEH